MGFVIVVGTVDNVDNPIVPPYLGRKTRCALNIGLILQNEHYLTCGLILENFLTSYPQKMRSYPGFYILTNDQMYPLNMGVTRWANMTSFL